MNTSSKISGHKSSDGPHTREPMHLAGVDEAAPCDNNNVILIGRYKSIDHTQLTAPCDNNNVILIGRYKSIDHTQ